MNSPPGNPIVRIPGEFGLKKKFVIAKAALWVPQDLNHHLQFKKRKEPNIFTSPKAKPVQKLVPNAQDTVLVLY